MIPHEHNCSYVYHLIPHAYKCSYVYHLIADAPKMFVLVAHLLDKGFNVPELCVGKTWCLSCKGRGGRESIGLQSTTAGSKNSRNPKSAQATQMLSAEAASQRLLGKFMWYDLTDAQCRSCRLCRWRLKMCCSQHGVVPSMMSFIAAAAKLVLYAVTGLSISEATPDDRTKELIDMAAARNLSLPPFL